MTAVAPGDEATRRDRERLVALPAECEIAGRVTVVVNHR
jgi:hypothetical protein